MKVIIQIVCVRCVKQLGTCKYGACRFDKECCEVCPENLICEEFKMCRNCKGGGL